MNQYKDLFDAQSLKDQSSDVPAIPGLTNVPAFLSPANEKATLHEIDLMPWRSDLKRRVQHYGYRYDYKARRVDASMYLGKLPPFAKAIAERLLQRALMTQMPDQLIVNEYLPGQGITAHIDCEPCFGERIVMISLAWAYEMEFIHSQTHQVRFILLERGSALAISAEARYSWLHQIKARKSESAESL